MKDYWSFSVFPFLLLVLRSSGLLCGPEEYPYGNVKCCRKCAPGTEMRRRCTEDADTLCQACRKGWYNPFFTTWECNPCTICERADGLQKVKKCESTSDTVCVCLPGYQPAASEPDEKRCDPCPKGHFSKGGEKACTPWTNCTATGRKTFRDGTEEDDAVCGNAPRVPRTTALLVKRSSGTGTARATSVTKPTSKPTSTAATSTALSTEGLPGGVKKSDYLLYVLVATALLLVLGGIILLKSCRRAKKYKEPGRFVEQMQKDGKNSFRVPIQEEQIDAKSSLVRN